MSFYGVWVALREFKDPILDHTFPLKELLAHQNIDILV